MSPEQSTHYRTLGGYATTKKLRWRWAAAWSTRRTQSQLLRRTIVDDAGGDALDAVLAAAITALAVSSGALPQPPEGWSDAFWEEGCIYY